MRARIVISLAVVMGMFILVTEVSVSKLVRVSVMRQVAGETGAGDGGDDGQANVEHELASLRRLTLFYLVLGAVAAIALSYLAVSRSVVAPLSKVTRAVERVAEGDFGARAPVTGSGEMVDLGVSFNKMTQILAEQRAELASRLEALERSSAELKSAQDGLVRAAKLASVGTLAAGIAHEIGNPIAGVLGLLEAVKDEEDPETRERYRALMEKEVSRVDGIIGDLLAFARPAPRSPGHEACSPAVVLDHAKSLLGAQRLFDRITLTTKVEVDHAAAMSGDDLTQVLVNLLLNAAQAMEGQGRVDVEVTADPSWRPALGAVEREAVRITVTDDGPGVSPEAAPGIFDPFFTDRTGGGGTGLGLAICQSICHRAGAEIDLDTEYANGARFVLHVPTA